MHGLIPPRFRPHCGSGLAWGHNWGCNMSSIDCARSSCVAIKQIHLLTRFGFGRYMSGTSFNRLPLFSGRRCLRPVLPSSVVTRNCRITWPQSTGVAATPSNGIIRHQQACCIREKAYPLRRGTTTRSRHRSPRWELPASTQRGNKPRAAKSRYERFNRRSSSLPLAPGCS